MYKFELLLSYTESSKNPLNPRSRKLTWATFQDSHNHKQDLCSVFLCSNDALVSLLTGYGRSLIYQICPVVAKELSNLEKQVPSEPIPFVVSPMNSLVSDQTNWCERMGMKACKVDMEMISTLLANEANSAYKTNCFFGSYSGDFC